MQFVNNLATGDFQVGAGCTFVKKGVGLLSIAAPQSHGVGAVVDGRADTINMNTDAGSNDAARNLMMSTTGGVINLNQTQHLAGVFASCGTINA